MNKKKRKEQRVGETYDQEKEENKALRNYLLDQNSSVEVGYSFILFVVNS